MDDTEIDLSKLSTIDACLWLLTSLGIDKFDQYAYTVPFSSYVMTWPRAVPLDSILILQSPYPNNIFPPIAAAMSYSADLCKKMMHGKELPPTVQVLANDLYINAGMQKEDSIAILKNGWALIDKGILMFNEAVFHLYNPEEAYLESIKQCSVIIRLLQETEKYGKRTVNIYAFGESGERVGSNLCSWFKSPIVKLSKRKVTHPAGIARRFHDLDHPDCHMGTPSFSKALAKTFSNYVAFMYTMGKKSDQDLRSERLQNALQTIDQHFPKVETSLNDFVGSLQELSTMSDNKDFLNAIAKVVKTADDLANRFRVANSMVNNVQSYGSSVAGNVARSAPSMKTDRPSESLLSEHGGRDANPATQLPISDFKLKSKKMSLSTPTKSESFTTISPPPSISSVVSEAPTPAISSTAIPLRQGKSVPPFVLKSKSNRSVTPSRPLPIESSVKSTSTNITRNDESNKAGSEADDIVSPLTKKFAKKAIVPKSKNKLPPPKIDDEFTSGVPRLTDKHMKILSSIQAIVEGNKEDAADNEECLDKFDYIATDIKNKLAYNFITQTLVQAIDKDIKDIPNFDINKWLSPTTDTCATFEVCKEEFEF